MNQPNNAALSQLMATVEDLRQAETTVAELKAQARREAHALATVEDPNQRIASAIYAYWYAPEVNAGDLALGATGQSHPSALLKLMGPAPIAVPCDRCQEDLPIRSRTEMKAVLGKIKREKPSYTEGVRVLCDDCWAAVRDQRSLDHAATQRAHSKAVAALRGLPYPDYLATEAWTRKRDQFLWFHLKERSSFHCETCNGAKDLGTYHSSLNGLGEHDHLVLLCPTCVGALRDAGKIVGPIGPGNLLTRQHAQAIQARFKAEHYGE